MVNSGCCLNPHQSNVQPRLPRGQRLRYEFLRLLTRFGLLLLVASAPTLQAQPTTPATRALVYRVDANPPEVVFRDGIRNRHPDEAPPADYDILNHVLGLVCAPNQRSAWISTTSSNDQVTDFLIRQLRHESAPLADNTVPDVELWVYTIEADDSYLDVMTVIHQVIQYGMRGQYGYQLRHSLVLQNILDTTATHNRAEVLTRFIAPSRILLARRVHRSPDGQTTLSDPERNPAFQYFTERDTNHLPDLAETVPPDSRVFGPTVAVNFGNRTCFLTCDGSATAREKRSVEQPPLKLDYCPADATRGQAFISSED